MPLREGHMGTLGAAGFASPQEANGCSRGCLLQRYVDLASGSLLAALKKARLDDNLIHIAVPHVTTNRLTR